MHSSLHLTLLVVILSLAVIGCKSTEEKACANALEIMKQEMPEGIEMPDKFASVDTCVEAISKDLDECTDRDAALECMADADDMETMLGCKSHCD